MTLRVGQVLTAVDGYDCRALSDLRGREVGKESVHVGGQKCLGRVLDCNIESETMIKTKCRTRTDPDGVLLSFERNVYEIVEGTQAVRRDDLIAVLQLVDDILLPHLDNEKNNLKKY